MRLELDVEGLRLRLHEAQASECPTFRAASQPCPLLGTLLEVISALRI